MIKFSIHFNQVFKKRGGRFLTVYKNNGKFNGKIIKTNPIWATMQEAKSGRKIKLLNFNIKFVVADHHYMTRYGNIAR
jgi:hypothetical protein